MVPHPCNYFSTSVADRLNGRVNADRSSETALFGLLGPLLIDALGVFVFVLWQDHLASEPEALGDIAHQGDLPFLFKVLSINKALSIQVI